MLVIGVYLCGVVGFSMYVEVDMCRAFYYEFDTVDAGGALSIALHYLVAASCVDLLVVRGPLLCVSGYLCFVRVDNSNGA